MVEGGELGFFARIAAKAERLFERDGVRDAVRGAEGATEGQAERAAGKLGRRSATAAPPHASPPPPPAPPHSPVGGGSLNWFERNIKHPAATFFRRAEQTGDEFAQQLNAWEQKLADAKNGLMQQGRGPKSAPAGLSRQERTTFEREQREVFNNDAGSIAGPRPTPARGTTWASTARPQTTGFNFGFANTINMVARPLKLMAGWLFDPREMVAKRAVLPTVVGIAATGLVATHSLPTRDTLGRVVGAAGPNEIKELANRLHGAVTPMSSSAPDYGFLRREGGGPNGEACNANLPALESAPTAMDRAAVRGLPTAQVPCVPK